MGAAVGAGLSAVSGLAQIFGGASEADEANRQAAETVRQTREEAKRRTEEVSKFAKKQEVQFLKSGVELEGSPLLVLEETRRKGAEEISDFISGQKAQVEATTRAGRRKFISGLFGGIASFGKGASGLGAFSGGAKKRDRFDVRPGPAIFTGVSTGRRV